jgi:hypothetical protein
MSIFKLEVTRSVEMASSVRLSTHGIRRARARVDCNERCSQNTFGLCDEPATDDRVESVCMYRRYR